MFRLPKEIWQYMEPLVPKKIGVTPKGGRPPLTPKKVADGIFYVLRTGCQWKAVPQEFGSGSSLPQIFSGVGGGRSFCQVVGKRFGGI